VSSNLTASARPPLFHAGSKGVLLNAYHPIRLLKYPTHPRSAALGI